MEVRRDGVSLSAERARTAAAAAAVILLAACGRGGSADGALLPDLVTAPPQSISVEAGDDGRFHLGFRSAGENIGAGPLVLEARRADVSTPGMTVEQLVTGPDGAVERRPVPAKMHYERSSDHSHWHYDDFMAYELRDASGGNLVVPAHKTGFCLGDRYDSVLAPPAEPAQPVYTGDCGPDDPAATVVTEGISVGFGDDYLPYLEGQSIDITGLPAGVYELVHRVNPDRTLAESDYENNATRVLLSVKWPAGPSAPPDVQVVPAGEWGP